MWHVCQLLAPTCCLFVPPLRQLAKCLPIIFDTAHSAYVYYFLLLCNCYVPQVAQFFVTSPHATCATFSNSHCNYIDYESESNFSISKEEINSSFLFFFLLPFSWLWGKLRPNAMSGQFCVWHFKCGHWEGIAKFLFVFIGAGKLTEWKQ